MNVLKRIMSPTPKFFQNLRNISLGFVAVGTVLVSSSVPLPLAIVMLGKYLIVAGTVASTVAQTTVDNSDSSN